MTPTLRIDLGRIVVESASPTVSRRFQRPTPSVSLDDYLKRRGGGRR